MIKKTNALILNAEDNVAVALTDLKSGTEVIINNSNRKWIVTDNIPYGHKLAVTDILKDEKILKYGEWMGVATTSIQTGGHVHVKNVRGLNEKEREKVHIISEEEASNE